MTGKQILLIIAVAIVVLSLLNIAFLLLFLGGKGLLGAFVGLVINIVLAVGLIAEQSWARWILLARCGFGAISSGVAFFLSLPQAGISQFSILGLWLLFEIAFCVALAIFLVASKRVSEVFSPSSGF